MRKITLSTNNETINTTCSDVSQHIWNKVVIHNISAKGSVWLDKHEGDKITVTTKNGNYMLDYITTALL
jgi:hypothetical protein